MESPSDLGLHLSNGGVQRKAQPAVFLSEPDSVSYRDNDKRFHTLHERHARRVWGYFRRNGFSEEEVKDLTQETFLRVFRYMKSMKGKTEAEEAAYINATAASVRANELRRQATRIPDAKEVPFDPSTHPSGDRTEGQRIPDPSPNPEEELIEKQECVFRRKRLDRALRELSPEKRRPVLLRLGRLSYKEIAAALQITLDTVKSRLYVAKKELREKLGENIDLPHELEEDDD